VRRSDGSGTTSIFTDYLSSANEKWKASVGKGTSVNWPVGIGGKGNEGVAGEVKQNPYAIGYVEEAYAVQNKLPEATIKNQAGNWIAPSLKGVTAAAANVPNIPEDLRLSIVNQPGPETYPISGLTWMLVYQKQTDKAKATALTRMLWWAITDGQQFNEALQYATVPPQMVAKCQDMIKKITVNGEPAFPGK
jgi:phosphate transport system substrate-binding protein